LTLEEYFGFSNLRLTASAVLSSSTRELEDRIAWEFMGGLEDAGLPIEYLGETLVTTEAGPGRALRWSRGEGTNWAIIFLPLCEGKITLVIDASGGGTGIWDEVRRAVRHVNFDDVSPACRFVKEDGPQ
jgi:hypothetical protein